MEKIVSYLKRNKVVDEKNDNQGYKKNVWHSISPIWKILKLFAMISFSVDKEKTIPKFTVFNKVWILISLSYHAFFLYEICTAFEYFRKYGSELIGHVWQIVLIGASVSVIICIFYGIFMKENYLKFINLLLSFDDKVSETGIESGRLTISEWIFRWFQLKSIWIMTDRIVLWKFMYRHLSWSIGPIMWFWT